jgi:hypothetical protein
MFITASLTVTPSHTIVMVYLPGVWSRLSREFP